MKDFIILDSEKVIDYGCTNASGGCYVQVYQPLTQDEQCEFESKLRDVNLRVARIDFDVCDRCSGTGKEDTDIWNDDTGMTEPTGSKTCTDCCGTGIIKYN